MKNLDFKRSLLAITSSFVIVSLASTVEEIPANYEIISDEENAAFAKYRNGFIYIGDEQTIREISQYANEFDILVIDERSTVDPNMIIIDSYRIKNKQDKCDIISCLLEYEKMYPSAWDRSFETMCLEWDIHNILYTIEYEQDRTKSVDLNNDDEYTYSLFLK